MTTYHLEMVLSAEAEVTRGCCGRDHEFGPCPFTNSGDQPQEGSEG